MRKLSPLKFFVPALLAVSIIGLSFNLKTVKTEQQGELRERSISTPAESDKKLLEEAFPQNTVPGEIVLCFENENALNEFLLLAKKQNWKVKNTIPALNAVKVEFSPEILQREFLGCQKADFNYRINLPQNETNPPREISEKQKGYNGNRPVGKDALALLGVTPENFESSQKGHGITVAILDSGIALEHPTLAHVNFSEIDIVKGAPDTPESKAHGTAVASLVAGNGYADVFGMASKAEILSVRVFDGNGNGDIFTLANGIVNATDAGAKVINISAGVMNDSALLKNAIAYAIQNGAVIVAAAGNEGMNGLAYPAAYPGVIAVGAVDGNGTVTGFSNAGEELCVVAPGVEVLAAKSNDTETAPFTGTSASAPLVAGIIAANLSDSGKDMNAYDVAELLANHSNDRGLPGADNDYGNGIVDFERISRPAGTIVSDLRVCELCLKNPNHGQTRPNLLVAVQNRGTVWTNNAVLSLKISLGNGQVSVSTSTIGQLPVNASTGIELQLPEDSFTEGAKIEAKLLDQDGNVLDQIHAKF